MLLPSDLRAVGAPAYRKKPGALVYARPMPRPFVVQTREGQMRGEAGDYLVQADDHTPEHPHQWPVARAYFERTYERAAPAAPAPDAPAAPAERLVPIPAATAAAITTLVLRLRELREAIPGYGDTIRLPREVDGVVDALAALEQRPPFQLVPPPPPNPPEGRGPGLAGAPTTPLGDLGRSEEGAERA